MTEPLALLKGGCLVVEDDLIIRLDLEETLRGFGFASVLGASTAEAAVQIVETEALCFAVLDYEMGRGNTLELAHLLVAKRIPAVFLTAYGMDLELPPDLSHIEVIAKPFASDLLAKALLRVLDETGTAADEGICCVGLAG